MFNTSNEAPNTTDVVTETPNPNAEQISMLTQSVSILARGFEDLKNSQAQSNAMVQQLATATSQTPAQIQHTAETLFGDDVDMDNMSNKDMAKLIAASVSKIVDTKINTLTGQTAQAIQNLAHQFETKNASEQIAKSVEKNADFFEYSDEMRQLLKENPTLTPARAYALAKAENPAKVEKLAAKYAKPNNDTGLGPISLLPTSYSSNNKGKGVGRMTQQDAAHSAFDAIFKDIGAGFNKQGNIII